MKGGLRFHPASVRQIAVKKRTVYQHYNDWLAARFERFFWGTSDCHRSYRNSSRHAPFLFPGSFKVCWCLQDERGMHEYDLY
jgi:cyclohexanone monooxygenase